MRQAVVDSSNYTDLYAVGVSAQQLKFIDMPAEFMLEVMYGSAKLVPFLLYNEGPHPVGFAALRPPCSEHPDDVALSRFLINTEAQGLGYGKRHLNMLIDYVKNTYPDAARMVLSVHVQALPARAVYCSVGFVEIGEVVDEHVACELKFR